MASPPSVSHHIVIIEPDVAVADAMRPILEEKGYRVTDGHSGRDTPASEATLAPDANICDFSYHAIDADLAFLQHLRCHPSTAVVPIVLCTGSVHTVKALSGRINALNLRTVFKPFNIEHLVATIAAMIARTPAQIS